MKVNRVFKDDFILLEEMYSDPFFPDSLVDRISFSLGDLIDSLDRGEDSRDLIQEELDKFTLGVNDLVDEFYDKNSEIDSMARQSIARTVLYILSYYNIKIGAEEALRLREW